MPANLSDLQAATDVIFHSIRQYVTPELQSLVIENLTTNDEYINNTLMRELASEGMYGSFINWRETTPNKYFKIPSL